MRVFLHDLLVAERQEYENSDYANDDPNNSVIITADDLRAAQRQLSTHSARVNPKLHQATLLMQKVP